MYWIHRIGRGIDGMYALHFDALWHLLENMNCLTIGWHNYRSTINSVESGDRNAVKIALAKEGIHHPENLGLMNFSEMSQNDIVIVLPISEYEPDFLVVQVLSPALSILKVPSKMQHTFTTYKLHSSGRIVNFDKNGGYIYDISCPMGGKAVDAGFFHEVQILNKESLGNRSALLKTLCDNVLGTNAEISDVTQQQHIYDTLIPEQFHSKIPRPI